MYPSVKIIKFGITVSFIYNDYEKAAVLDIITPHVFFYICKSASSLLLLQREADSINNK